MAEKKSTEHFERSAKLNLQKGNTFRYLGHYYARISVNTQRAFKCYWRSITLNPNYSDSGQTNVETPMPTPFALFS